MNHTDQYRKLEELYAEMSDRRLEEMAEQIDNLTDMAKEVLEAEISRRGLGKGTPEAPVEGPVPSGDELVGVWGVKDDIEAESVMSVLESAGIPAVLGVEQYELVDGGFEDQLVVKVVRESRLRAMELLHQHFPRELEQHAADELVVVCPSCKSPDIIFQSLDSQPGTNVAAKFNWSCDACGHQWRDDGLVQLA